jgi:predicted metal-dependent peptidase
VEISLSEAFTYLMSAKKRDFCARTVSALVRVKAPGIGTLAVGISRDGRLCLFYDPAFIATLTLPKLVIICWHEVLHLALDHIPRFLNLLVGCPTEEDKARLRVCMNYAADFATNELIRMEKGFDNGPDAKWLYGCEEDPRGGLLPDRGGFNFPRKLSFEEYMALLNQNMKHTSQKIADGLSLETYSIPMPKGEEEQEGAGQGQGQGKGEDQKDGQGGGGSGEGDQDGQDGKGGGGGGGGSQMPQQGAPGPAEGTPEHVLDQFFKGQTGGSHRFWEGETNHRTAEELQGLADRMHQDAKQLLTKSVREHMKSRGTIPAGLKQVIEAFLAPPKIPWPKVLRSLCTRTQQSKPKRGLARPNRRLHGMGGILPFPGRTQDHKFTIAFAVDTSGSMSEEDLELALVELLNIVRTETDVTLWVMYCDADLHVTYDVESIGDVDFNVVGRGGTDFNPPFIKVRELLRTDRAPDILIYATDGYAPEPEPENRVPIPVVWLVTPDGKVPSPTYGVHIQMEPF